MGAEAQTQSRSPRMNTESAEGEQRLAPWTPAPTEPVEGMRRAREGAREKNSQQNLEASRREAGKGCSEKDRTINRAKFYREGRRMKTKQDWAF